MKIVSIIILGFSLFLSNVALAAGDEAQPNAKAIEQVKANILKAVSVHVDVLNKFKSCVAKAKVKADLGACKKQKQAAMKALQKKVKRARPAKDGKNKK